LRLFWDGREREEAVWAELYPESVELVKLVLFEFGTDLPGTVSIGGTGGWAAAGGATGGGGRDGGNGT